MAAESRNVAHISDAADVRKHRIELAAALRLAAKFGLNEAIDNHFSFALDHDRFLINGYGKHWSMMTAGDVLVIDGDGKILDGRGELEPTAFFIHRAVHRRYEQARAVLHTHMPYSTAIACAEGGRLLPISQTYCLFHDRIGYDEHYNGMGDHAQEGDRIASAMGGRPVALLASHGPIVTGPTMGQAFSWLYYLERAAELQVLAEGRGQPLKLLSDDVVQATRDSWDSAPLHHDKHFAALMAMLDKEQPEYREFH
ncbi:MAG TPA: class II aldolase/adducin family protein [Geminicoccus sp.]|jgi:ribulose-5-phosphate 4-epimerase/fuculose-1-phosphate aldolase|uniref:class II aldolase/adducin family protein n=1 Tax=Geminicoccus sp. TaxID=2024832 RepID=UPI002E33F990|nr:class II aldolase/adducin family protein [Geminicoccus sp.]HEX2527525.1 class II aldolase/adducin family protein [Geminicoccus sp.]